MDDKFRYIDFEVEATSTDDAKAKIADIHSTFGDCVCIKVHLVSGSKERAFATLDTGMKKLFEDISKKIGGKD